MPVCRPSTASWARRALTLGAVAATSVSLAACTAQNAQKNDLTGTEGEVQDVIQRLADRADDGNSAVICREIFTAKLSATFAKGGSCADNVSKAIANADYTSLNVRTVRLIGASNQTQAQAIIKTVEDQGDRQINLVKGTDGKWRIDGIQPKVTPASELSTSPGTTPAATTPAG